MPKSSSGRMCIDSSVEMLGLDCESWCDETHQHGPLVRPRFARQATGRARALRWKTTRWPANQLNAPMVVDGAMNGRVFLQYGQVLAPTLAPGDKWIISPVTKPLEFAKRSKRCKRKSSTFTVQSRLQPDRDGLLETQAAGPQCRQTKRRRTLVYLGQTLDRFPGAECRRYLQHCGYTATPA